MRAPEFVEKSEIKKFHVVFPEALVGANIFIKTSENEIVNPLPIGEEIEKGGTKFAPINKTGRYT